MELDELKSIWKGAETAAPRLNESEVLKLLKSRSTSIIAKIKRNIWFEIVLLIVASLGVMTLAWNLNTGPIQFLMYSIVALHSLYLFYFIKKLQLLVNFNYSNQSLFQNLSLLNERLSSFLKFYRQSFAVIYPVYILVGIVVVFLELGEERFIEFVTGWRGQLFLVLYALSSVLMSSYVIKWYIKSFYGDHLDHLKMLLKEFDETLGQNGANGLGH